MEILWRSISVLSIFLPRIRQHSWKEYNQEEKKKNLHAGSKELENVRGVLEYELVMHFKCGLEFHTFFFSLPHLN